MLLMPLLLSVISLSCLVVTMNYSPLIPFVLLLVLFCKLCLFNRYPASVFHFLSYSHLVFPPTLLLPFLFPSASEFCILFLFIFRQVFICNDNVFLFYFCSINHLLLLSLTIAIILLHSISFSIC